MLLNCGVGEDSWESLGLQRDPTSPSWKRSVLGVHWKDWCWSWNSSTLATWCKELTHWKRPWCWERLKVGGEGDDRGWDGWLASLTQWTWVWVNSGSRWCTRKLACCSPWGHKELDMTEWPNWTEPRDWFPWHLAPTHWCLSKVTFLTRTQLHWKGAYWELTTDTHFTFMGSEVFSQDRRAIVMQRCAYCSLSSGNFLGFESCESETVDEEQILG